MGAQGMFWKGGAAVAVFLLWLATGVSCENVVGGKPLDVCSSCHVNATCEEKAGGRKVCNCFYGFVGNGRTQCQDKDECQIGAQKICGEHTTCHNTYGSFFCTCLSGYAPSNNMSVFIPNDGTYCDDIDECNVQGICGEGGRCSNVKGDFNCFCQEGFRVHNGLEPFHPKRDGAFCEAIDCGKPPSIAHASLLSETGTGYGSRARFGCLDGFFRKSGEDSGLCGDEGVWEGLSLECVEIECGEPPVLLNTRRLWDGNKTVGSVVFYHCKEGYSEAGERNTSLCAENGSWTEALLCKEIDCGEPPVPPHSVMLWNRSSRMGSEVHYRCEAGFNSAGGGNVSVCSTDGRWSRATVLCKEIECGEPPVLLNTRRLWDGNKTVGSVVFYHCKEGYSEAGGRNTSLCAENGSWTEALLCKEIDCGEPPVPPHSVMLWNRSSRMGSEVHYRCEAGFNSAGGGNVSVCSTDGRWSRATVLCKEIECGEPPVLLNTRRLWDGNKTVGSVVFYHCKEGYSEAGGRNTSLCAENGSWTEALLCKEIDCGEPPVPPHSVMLWNRSSRMGSEVHYRCEAGFNSAGGGNVSVCSTDGRWSRATVLCKEIDCGPPPVLPGTDLQWDRTTGLGSVARYTCKDGFYQEKGSGYSECTSDRKWKTITITCTVSCGPAPQPPHSEVAWQSGHLAGSTVHHRCQDGYRRRAGNNASLCTPAGWWQAATLLCREIKPVMSDLEVFNERCLRWKADVYSGEKVDYLAEFVGSRDYQRTFLDKRKRLFSSSAVRPELCLNLFPGTNYTVNITATSERFSLIVSANTSIQAPPAPKLIFRDVEAPLPTLWLQRSIHTMDPISMYQVFVLPVEGSVVFDCRSPRTPSFHQRSSSDEPYVAAQVSLLEMGARLNFTVGDQRRYGGFYNAPLEIDRDYFVIVRLLTRWGTVRRYSCVIWAKVKGTSYTVQSVTLLVGGSVGMISFVIFLGYSYYWYCQKK